MTKKYSKFLPSIAEDFSLENFPYYWVVTKIQTSCQRLRPLRNGHFQNVDHHQNRLSLKR